MDSKSSGSCACYCYYAVSIVDALIIDVTVDTPPRIIRILKGYVYMSGGGAVQFLLGQNGLFARSLALGLLYLYAKWVTVQVVVFGEIDLAFFTR